MVSTCSIRSTAARFSVADGPCGLWHGERRGWEAIALENGVLRVTVLPGKGADIVELARLDDGVNALFEAPWGLQPPAAAPRGGSDGHAFLENYEGGWQSLFPSVGDPCSYGGRTIPFHGEVATLPWDVVETDAASDSVTARLAVACRMTPFRLERTLRLRAGHPFLEVEETATNESAAEAHLVWGHHIVVGPPLLAAGAVLNAPARTIVTIPELWEDTARLEPGQRSDWPDGLLRSGGTVDLRQVPGPEAESHDDVYLTDLEAGWVTVENPRLGLSFRLDFDASLFRWLVSWQAYGGARALPLAGSYALGIEPWTTRLPLEQAVAAAEAIVLGPGERLSTTVRATFERTAPPAT
jgi:galactose mutarotase-like enzyme